ncbi:hypothetical protein X975_05751, partial [Stegodyphus mimosarum]
MAFKQLTSHSCKLVQSYVPFAFKELNLVFKKGWLPCFAASCTSTRKFMRDVDTDAKRIEKFDKMNFVASFNHTLISSVNKEFIDPFMNNLPKKFYMPTNAVNNLKVYEDINIRKKSIEEPILNNIKIIDAPIPNKPPRKEAVRMLRIRRRKMRKHKLQRLRKRMKNVFEKIKMRRELRKEQAFRAELLSQVEIAEKFDAKAYVEGILHTLRYHPKPETDEERREKYRQLLKKNRYQ